MDHGLGYHIFMKRLSMVAGFLLVCATFMLAQINGVPASVSSIGFGGNFGRPPGVPASVTSIGPAGLVPNNAFIVPNNLAFPNCCFGQFFPNNVRPQVFPHRHHDHQTSISFFPVPYAVPVAVPYGVEDVETDSSEQMDYRGAPTILEPRGPQPSPQLSYAPAAATEPLASPAPAAETAPDQPQTMLVFKDGHRAEVQNYAIVGDTLYDLTAGHRRKINLAELDLDQTIQQNEDRGLQFEVPHSAGAN